MYIQEQEIQRIFTPKNWQLAVSYQTKDIIEEIEILHDEEHRNYRIRAVVEVYGYENDLSLTLTEGGEITRFHCDCPFCEDDEVACAHIGVVLLTVYDLTPVSFPYYYQPATQRKDVYRQWLEQQMMRKSKAFIEHFAEQNNSEFHANLMSEKVKILAFADMDGDIPSVSFKVGIQKFYVIKNLLNFVSAIEEHKNFSYGKNLSFYHCEEAFDDVSQLILHFIQKYIKDHFMQFEYGYGSSRRSMELDPDTIDDFYELYHDEASDYIDMKFEDSEISTLPILIEQQDEFYALRSEIPMEQLTKGNEYWYLIDHHTIHRLQKEVSTTCDELLRELKVERQILIHKDDMIDFCKYVIPTIRDHVELKGVSLEPFMPYPIFIQSYVDVEENGDISIKITYHFEDMPIQYAIAEQVDEHLDLERILMFVKEYASVVDYDAHVAYINENDPLVMSFLKNGLEYMNQLSEVFISDAIKQMNSPKHVSMQVGVRMQNNLLEIDVNSVQIPRDELVNVLRSYRKRKKYHRLKNGDLIFLQSEEVEEVDDFLQDLHLSPTDLANGAASLPTYHTFELENFAKDAKYTEVQRNKQFQTMVERIKDLPHHTQELSEHYQGILRDYQKFGYQWLSTMSEYGFGGILADDMGLGKTLQVIALLEEDYVRNPQHTSIVICPASLIFNWRDEVEKFSTRLTCLCVHGTTANRKKQISDAQNYALIVTSYDYIRRDYETYADQQFHYIILDEAQYIKNHTTKNAFAVKQLQGTHRFALTGTPIENSLAELWSIFDFLMPGYLYNYHYFRANFEREIVKNKNEKAQQKLKRMVEPFILRRVKKDVLKELPDKTESVYFQEFNDEEQKIYLANLAQINSELQIKLQMEEMDKFMILAMMTRLRQICCDTRLLYENINQVSTKLQGCLDIVNAAKTSGKKVLLFSSFTSMLDLIEAEFLKENIRYLKLTGETKKEQRHAYVEKFQNEPYDVFLISLKAGGTGLNLTAAEIVIHYDPWWNMSAQNQATDRAHRIGQTKNVQVYKLIMKDSIEEKILKLQERKMNLSDAFVAGNEGSITSMSNEEIMDLFR